MKTIFLAFFCFALLVMAAKAQGLSSRSVSQPAIGSYSVGGVATPAGKYTGVPAAIAPEVVNPYTGNATRVINDISVAAVGEIGLSWTRFHETRLTPGSAWFGAGGSWRHSYEWDCTLKYGVFSYTPGTYINGVWVPPVITTSPLDNNGEGVITLTYPDGTQNLFVETKALSGIFLPSSNAVTDYIVIEGATSVNGLGSGNSNYINFRLINSSNQAYHFTQYQTSGSYSYANLTSISDSKGQVTTLVYSPWFGFSLLSKIVEPGGRFISIQYAQYLESSAGSGFGAPTTTYGYVISSVTTSDSRMVTYHYTADTVTGPKSSLTMETLTSVQYPESSSSDPQSYATYTYDAIYSATGQNSTHFYYAPLRQAADTHSAGIPKVTYKYWTDLVSQSNPISAPIGAVYSITESTSNTVIVVTGLDSTANQNAPLVTYPDTSAYGYTMTGAGWLQQTQNIQNNYSSQNYSPTAGQIGTDAGLDYVTSTSTLNTTATNSNNQNLATSTSAFGHILTRTWPIVPPETSAPYETWTYNSGGYLLTYTDTLNHQTKYTRDPATNLVMGIAYPDGTSESFTYGAFNEVATHTRRNGGIEYYYYYGATDYGGAYNGMLKSVQDAAGGTTIYMYDAHYHLASVTNANNHTTGYLYNLRGQLTQQTNPATTANPTTRIYGYDDWGNLISVQDELQKIWNYRYDGFNRLINAQEPVTVGRSVTYAYDPKANCNPNPISVTNDQSHKETFYTYVVNWGYKVSTATTGYGSASPSTTTYTYDADGNVATIVDPRDPKPSSPTIFTKVLYDARDRAALATDPVGNQSFFYYDDASNLTSQVTPDGTTRNHYDSMNRLMDSTDPKLQESYMTYDSEGSLATYKDPNSNLYKYMYDNDERQLSMQYPDGTLEGYTYYPAGNLWTYATRDKRTETLYYDQRERQTSSGWDDGVTPGVSTTYYDNNAVLAISNSNSAISYIYDDAGDTLSETQTVTGLSGGKAVGYTYNSDGLVGSLTYPDTTGLTYIYDNRNELTDIFQGSAATPVVHYAYDLAGNRTAKNLANGVTSVLSYDNVQRLVSINDLAAGGASLQTFGYGYDGMSRRKYVKRSTAPSTGDAYSYDTSGQLHQVLYGVTNPDTTPVNPQRTVIYNFDASGNRTSFTDQLVTEPTAFTLNYSPNADNQYTSVGAASLGYDGRGNLTSYQEHGPTTSHTVNCSYDANSLLLSATNNFDSTSLTQAYDPLGRCVKRVENGVTTFFVYDAGWNVMAEYNASGTQQARYVGGAATDEMLTKTDAAGNILYYHTDGLGSVTKITNSAGAVVESYTYDVYGNPSISNAQGSLMWISAVGNRFLFTGREYLYSFGVYDYRTRIYDPYLGRFWQPDPIGHAGDGYNLHRYCGNDPVNNIDPFGEDDNFSFGYGGGAGSYINQFESGTTVYGYAYNGTNWQFYYYPGSGGAGGIPSQFADYIGFGYVSSANLEAAHIAQVKATFAQNSTFSAISSASSMVVNTPAAFHGGSNAYTPQGPDLDGIDPGVIKAGIEMDLLVLTAPIAPEELGLEAAEELGLEAAEGGAALPEGSFSISNWKGYPDFLPQPAGPFRLLEGDEYAAARAEANQANAALREQYDLTGMEIHEIQPVKFGGSPTDISNKIPLPTSVHRSEVTPWWNAMQRSIEGGN